MPRRLALAAALALLPQMASSQLALIAPTAPVSTNNNQIATTAWVNNFVANGLPLANGKIFIGSAGGVATAQTPSGDCTLAASGVITCTQSAGNFTVNGTLSVTGGELLTNIAAPATPAAGKTQVYVDSTQKVLTAKNDAGTVSNTVVPSTCTANQWANAISSGGVIGCAQPSIGNISGLGAGVATFLGTPSSANLLAALTTKTGTGNAVFGTSPSIATPTLTGLTTGTCANGLGVAAGGAVINVSCPGSSATFQSSTALSPASTASTTATMSGMGATCKITPTSTGRVKFAIEGRGQNNTANDGIALQLYYGTGTAPANAAAVTGTSPSGLNMVLVTTAAGSPPSAFSVTGIVTGLALSTQVWFDLSQAAFTGGTASISAAACNAFEF